MIERLEFRLAFSAYDLPLDGDAAVGRMAVTARGTLVITDDMAREQVLRLTVGDVEKLAGRIQSNPREVGGTASVSIRPFVGNGFDSMWLPTDMERIDAVAELQRLYPSKLCWLLQDVVNGVNILVPVNAFRRARIELGGGNDRMVIQDRVVRPIEINGGLGADRIDSFSDGVTIDGGAGSDRIGAYCDRATLAGGSGDDRVFAQSTDVVVDGGLGRDTLVVSGTGLFGTAPIRIEEVSRLLDD